LKFSEPKTIKLLTPVQHNSSHIETAATKIF
jgi:hypothetical protein